MRLAYWEMHVRLTRQNINSNYSSTWTGAECSSCAAASASARKASGVQTNRAQGVQSTLMDLEFATYSPGFCCSYIPPCALHSLQRPQSEIISSSRNRPRLNCSAFERRMRPRSQSCRPQSMLGTSMCVCVCMCACVYSSVHALRWYFLVFMSARVCCTLNAIFDYTTKIATNTVTLKS